MGRAWQTGIPVRLKANVFKGLVANTMLSGMEAERARPCDLEKMESCLMGLARRLLGRESVYQCEGKNRQRPNRVIREKLGLMNLRDVLRVRRLKWLLDIIRHPGENLQLRAALGGPTRSIGGDINCDEYVPWLDLICDDLE